MIDTIRFKISTSKDLYREIRQRGVEVIEKNNESGKSVVKTYKKAIKLGSYNYNINVFAYIEDIIFIEFSAPKVYYGHNIFLLYLDKLPFVLDTVKSCLEHEFKYVFPEWNKWIVQRLDISYAWRFDSSDTAFTVVQILNSYEYARKTKHIFDTSFSLVGSAYDIKLYMKGEEFKKHDFKRFMAMNKIVMAHNLLSFSDSILRFEIRLKKEQLTYIFKKEITILSITNEFILDRLNHYLHKLLKSNITKIMPRKEIYDKLFTIYSPRKAGRLMQFLNTYYSADEETRKQNRRILKNKYHTSSLSRNFKDLREAGIGILDFNKNVQFELTIPSTLAVNSANIDPAAAGAMFDEPPKSLPKFKWKSGEAPADLDETAQQN